jgi:hypothetical protein
MFILNVLFLNGDLMKQEECNVISFALMQFIWSKWTEMIMRYEDRNERVSQIYYKVSEKNFCVLTDNENCTIMAYS